MARFDDHAPADVVLRIPAGVCIFGAALCFLNGQYYMQVVVGNTFITTRMDPIKGKTHAYNS